MISHDLNVRLAPRQIAGSPDGSKVDRFIPQADECQVWIDFDGTITSNDVLDELISRYAVDDRWREAERLWQAGSIGSFECLTRQFESVRISQSELVGFLRAIQLDPGAAPLFELFSALGVPCAVLSDGIEQFIRPILRRAGIDDAVIRSNRVKQVEDRLELVCPHRAQGCASAAAHCKCASASTLSQTGRKSIYIGDGRSDLCPSRSADIVFAKGMLARSLDSEGISFFPFDMLADVALCLSQAWSEPAATRILRIV